MKVLIVEDEPFAAERLTEQLKKYDTTIEVLEVLDSVEDSINYVNEFEKKVDLAFLDIQLADGKSFEIFRKTNFFQPIIFTTAYDQYAIDAFQHNSIDYLLKPVKYDHLVRALEKFKKIKPSDNPYLSKELINELLSSKKSYKQRFLVKYGSHIQFKSAGEIALIRADDKLCHIIQNGSGRQYLIDHTLEELDQNLLDPSTFFRINRKFIVNVNAIKDIKSLADNRLEIMLSLPFDEKLYVSRGRAKNFKLWIDA